MSIADFYSMIQIKLFISFTSFRFYLALITKKYVFTEKRIFFQKDLLVARNQLPNNIPITYFPYIYAEYRKSPSNRLKIKCFKIDQVYSNTRVPTQVNTSQHESTRVNTSPTRVNTNQHESKTGPDKILLKI